jgi:proton-translocating NADH-quinone oxidoreductase chain L
MLSLNYKFIEGLQINAFFNLCLLLIVASPLISFIYLSLVNELSKKKIAVIAIRNIFIPFVLTSFLICHMLFNINSFVPYKYDLCAWIDVGNCHVSWLFIADALTLVMCFLVTLVSLFVHIYSTEYMKEDVNFKKFISFLSLFTFFMLVLITSGNFAQLFVGWEGVGLASYLLINFWYTRPYANQSAMKAMILNRIGDLGLVLGMAMIFKIFESINFNIVFSLIHSSHQDSFYFIYDYFDQLTLICFFLFIGSIGKSAQVGLHTWLPDAMEGPTPVSALIHAATMVTAGVFLILRCSIMFEYAPAVLLFITFIGGLTAFFASTIGLVQTDLKKVIAYSTCSQLGYMIFACGLSNYYGSIFHLINHGFFKALLFLSAGVIIHAMHDEQDIRKMGGLIYFLPLTYMMMLIGSLSLMGFPFLTGFYSKDFIIESAYSFYTIPSHFVFWIGSISAFFTACYSIRLIYLIFLSDMHIFKSSLLYIHDLNNVFNMSLSILAFNSIFFGYLTKDMMIGLGTSFWGNSLFMLPQNNVYIDAEFLPVLIKLIPVFLSITASLITYLAYSYSYGIYFTTLGYFNNFEYEIYLFLIKKWYFDKIYNTFMVFPLLKFSYYDLIKSFDKGFFEIIGPIGINYIFYYTSLFVSKLQTGYIYQSIFQMIIGFILILNYILHV